MLFFSQLVGRKGSRIRGFKGSRVCFLKIASGLSASSQPPQCPSEVLTPFPYWDSPDPRITTVAFLIHPLSRRRTIWIVPIPGFFSVVPFLNSARDRQGRPSHVRGQAKAFFLKMFSLPYPSPGIIDRTFAKPFILFHFTAFHLNPWILEPLNPSRIIN